MHKRHKYDIVVILAVVALAISLYLSVAESLNLAVPCDLTGGCEDVLNSRYSRVFGLPLANWGVVYFGAIVILALLSNHYRKWRKVLTGSLGLGALASLIFMGLQFFVIRAVCQYCLATDLLTVAIFLWDLNIEHHNPDLKI